MSIPTEQTLVQASSLSSERAPSWAASIIPASSETGMNAPLIPPTEPLAIAPPFFTEIGGRGFEFVEGKGAGWGRFDHPCVFGDRNERATHPAARATRHRTAFFH